MTKDKLLNKGVVLGVFVLLFLTIWGSKSAYALDFSSAKYIDVNTDEMGCVLDGYNREQNIYKFTTMEDGYVDVKMTYPRQNNSESYWEMELYNASYSRISSAYAYGNYEQAAMMPEGLSAGDYYLVVKSTLSGKAKSTDIFTVNVGYVADPHWEKEFNDSYSSATLISVNTEYHGNTRDGYNREKDYYKFTIDNNGYVDISLSYERQGTTDSIWQVYLYNDSNKEIYNRYAYGNEEKMSFPSMGLSAGDYYVMIQSPNSGNCKTTATYSLNVGFSSSDYWESEFNDNFNSADSVLLNGKYYGTIRNGYNYEKDYYTFTLKEEGYVDVNFYTERQGSTDSFWEFYLYDENEQQIDSRTRNGNVDSGSMPRMGLPAGKYYFKVQSVYSGSAKSSDVYSFSIDFTATDKYEKEFNESYTTANPIKVNTYYNGTIRNGYNYEKDFYSIDFEETGFYTVRFKASQQSTSNDCWQVKIYDENYKEVKHFNVSGNDTNIYAVYEFAAKKYYICVTSTYSGSSASTSVYSLSVRKVKPTLPQIKSIKAKKTYVTINWNKSEDVQGYEIQYSTSKNFGAKSTESILVSYENTSTIIEELKSGKKYYFRVRSYATYLIDGIEQTYYSGWSKRKSAKTNK